MKMLNITISDAEYAKYGISNNEISFSDLVDMVCKELMRKNLSSVINTAEKYGLSSISMEDITTEVHAVRKNAKNNS